MSTPLYKFRMNNISTHNKQDQIPPVNRISSKNFFKFYCLKIFAILFFVVFTFDSAIANDYYVDSESGIDDVANPSASGVIFKSLVAENTDLYGLGGGIGAYPAYVAVPGDLRIMPLGDSITEGTGGNYNGYRGYLYALLSTSGYSFTFVGSMGSDPFKHEGHFGWPAHYVFEEVYGWLTANPADIVLLHIGTNDITGGESTASCATDINDILDQIDEYEADHNVEIMVILARIINRCNLCDTNYRQKTTELNMEIQNLTDIRRAVGDKIIVVDMENGAGINYNVDNSYPYTDGDIYDDVHPNDSGYARIAQVWFNAININAQPTTTTSVQETTSTTTNPLTTTTSTTTIPPMSIYGKVTGDIKADVTINLYKVLCVGNSLVSTTSTNADGFYIFAYVSDGNYNIEAVYSGCSFSPSNYINVSPYDNVSSDFSATCP